MNTPNKLTVAKMILVPFLVLFMLTGWGKDWNRFICLAIFVVASISEFKIWTLVGFVSACVVAFVVGYIRMQRNFEKLRENLQELKDKQEESE